MSDTFEKNIDIRWGDRKEIQLLVGTMTVYCGFGGGWQDLQNEKCRGCGSENTKGYHPGMDASFTQVKVQCKDCGYEYSAPDTIIRGNISTDIANFNTSSLISNETHNENSS